MTIEALIERIYRDYLDSPSDQSVQSRIVAQVSDSQGTVVYAADLAQEEIAHLTVGTIIEMEFELMRVTAHNESTRTLTVLRGVLGTTAAEHPANTIMRVAPKMPRQGILNLVGDAVDSLSPPLYAVATTWGDPVDGMVELPADPVPISLLGATQLLAGEAVELEGRIVRDELIFATGVGITFVPRCDEDVNLRYTVEVTRPTAGTETYEELGIETSWEKAIIYSVLSGVLIQPDIDARTQEFITEALQSQGFPPTTGTNLSVALSRMHEVEVQKARNRLRSRNGVRTNYRSVL